MTSATGTQFTVTSGSTSATITQVAAALRAFSVDGVDAVQSYSTDTVAPYGSGTVLVPWPNRVDGGTWSLDGVEQQLDITEPKLHNAIHGLLRWCAYEPVAQSDSSLTLAASVFPQHGYPFHLETTISYTVTDGELEVVHTIVNVGDANAPVAIGTHPFITIGDVPAEDLVLSLAAGTHFPVDERLIPTAEEPVDGTDWDLRAGKRLGDLTLDDGFGAVEHVDGVATHALTAPDGRRVELWQDDNFGYVQAFTTRLYPVGAATGLAVAVEPMTAPTNAFVTGQSLKWLAPGEQWEARWGIRYRA
jgi:aldose 1-epimerase